MIIKQATIVVFRDWNLPHTSFYTQRGWHTSEHKKELHNLTLSCVLADICIVQQKILIVDAFFIIKERLNRTNDCYYAVQNLSSCPELPRNIRITAQKYHFSLCIGSWWGNRREGDHWGDLDVDGCIILGWISRRWDVGIWTGLGWPRIETGGGRLWVR